MGSNLGLGFYFDWKGFVRFKKNCIEMFWDGMLAMEKGLVFVIGTSKFEILNSTYTVIFIRDPSLG